MATQLQKKHGVHRDRSLARMRAMQLLYQAEITGETYPELLARTTFNEEVGSPPEHACTLIRILNEHLEEIDAQLAQASANWKVERMPLVDRCILRLAVCEMVYLDEVPLSVSINEAIELARSFGGEDSSAGFVNGVLGNIARGGKDRTIDD
jgi:N utilization substance protein B